MHTVFDEFNRFEEVGGWPQLNQGLGLPMVLVMSIWNDVSLPHPQHPASAKGRLF